ncbi:acyl-CoA dehydrogenase [Blyttiomyces helicus]|uniref:Acyl-CoA dehydrogenase n=1 Tax=Blyttiomyces helicus TaxID=388810 RepID=A0A4P9WL21_9FUNG|nr:acyl-CoA dehydrogenase [Blyttiomyces helicus]|eukprot:RKO92743.1 acyl-CoA dehydrogenase [Blyttiomyces helicus]
MKECGLVESFATVQPPTANSDSVGVRGVPPTPATPGDRRKLGESFAALTLEKEKQKSNHQAPESSAPHLPAFTIPSDPSSHPIKDKMNSFLANSLRLASRQATFTTSLRAASRTQRRALSLSSITDPKTGLTEDELQYATLAKDFADKEFSPKMLEWDEKEAFPVDSLKKAAEMGFGAIYCSEEFGGTGLGRMDASLIFENLSTGCVSTTAYLSIHKCVDN